MNQVLITTDDNPSPEIFRLRESVPDDLAFVLHTMTIELKKRHPYHYMERNIYNGWMSGILKSVLANSSILIACDAEDPTHIYGFLVFENREYKKPVLHFIYVKSNFRHIGIGTLLAKVALPSLGNEPVITTTLPLRTDLINAFKTDSKDPIGDFIDSYKLIFNPFLLTNNPEPKE